MNIGGEHCHCPDLSHFAVSQTVSIFAAFTGCEYKYTENKILLVFDTS